LRKRRAIPYSGSLLGEPPKYWKAARRPQQRSVVSWVSEQAIRPDHGYRLNMTTHSKIINDGFADLGKVPVLDSSSPESIHASFDYVLNYLDALRRGILHLAHVLDSNPVTSPE